MLPVFLAIRLESYHLVTLLVPTTLSSKNNTDNSVEVNIIKAYSSGQKNSNIGTFVHVRRNRNYRSS